MKNKKNQKGFTLIELALIIAVLGILGAVGAVKLASMTTEANDAAEKTALANARSALAIAIAKDMTQATVAGRDGKVSEAEFASYLEGYNTTTKQIDGKVKIKLLDLSGAVTTTDVVTIQLDKD